MLFVFCRNPNTAAILDSGDGHIITTLPIGHGVDAAEFDAATGEAFSSQGDGTLTVIKKESPSLFAIEQTVATKAGARTSTLDTKTHHILLVTADRKSAPPAVPAATATPGAPTPWRDRMQTVPDTFTMLVVGW